MARAWLENGPISLPSATVTGGAAALLTSCAILGLALGYVASYRKGAAPDPAGMAGQKAGADVVDAKPIVDLSPPPPAPSAAKAEASDDDDDKADDLAAQTAAAQSIQAKPSKSSENIDDVLTSPNEKPPPVAKTPAVETPPGAPVRSDVPF